MRLPNLCHTVSDRQIYPTQLWELVGEETKTRYAISPVDNSVYLPDR